MKSNRFLTIILSGAMALPIAALAQTGNSAATSGDTGSATASQTENQNKRGEKFAEALNLTPEQKTDLKNIRENEKQQAQAIKNDSSLNADQKKAKLKALRKDSHQQMMAKLTPDQQQKFKDMRKENRGHWRGGHKKGQSGETQG